MSCSKLRVRNGDNINVRFLALLMLILDCALLEFWWIPCLFVLELWCSYDVEVCFLFFCSDMDGLDDVTWFVCMAVTDSKASIRSGLDGM
jgi:hypothetical protein